MTGQIAMKIEWPVSWGADVYEPAILASDGKLLLLHSAKAVSEGSKIRVVGDAKDDSFVVIIEFLNLIDFRYGRINEDDIYYCAEGLTPYGAYEILNSRWIEEMNHVFSEGREIDLGSWSQYHHYVLGFHDSRVECIAKSYYIEAYDSSNKDIFDITYDRITGEEWWMKTSKSGVSRNLCKWDLDLYASIKTNSKLVQDQRPVMQGRAPFLRDVHSRQIEQFS